VKVKRLNEDSIGRIKELAKRRPPPEEDSLEYYIDKS
jgi:hypothetical protein